MNVASSVLLGTAIGALDGVASSGDIIAGRSEDSSGIGEGGGAVFGWSWAVGLQVASVALGAGLVVTDHESGRAPLFVGTGLMARALAFKAGQHRQTTPVKAQGFRARPLTRFVAINSPERGIGVQYRATSVG